MGYNTKIDWSDSSWNPVTGCLHDCKYCYARKMAHRYAGHDAGSACSYNLPQYNSELVILDKPMEICGRKAMYPFDFAPTFHCYRLDVPQRWSSPRNIFVCSMSDLFGDWVPNRWIQDVLEACDKAPRHRYLFLTKNPKRYAELYLAGIINYDENFWFGASATTQAQLDATLDEDWTCGIITNWFLSIEPILEPLSLDAIKKPGWVIVGAETGTRKDKVVPRREWIEAIAEKCADNAIPLFMKNSLRELMGDNFVQQYPWRVEP